nr:AbiV family abortive infection protein [uncultured Carboxylicivirga sp.]
MKKFSSISRIEALEIYPRIIDNFNQLKKVAHFAYDDNNFGTAQSLYILSSEELIKSFVIYLHGVGGNVFQIKEIKGIFSDHKTKHEFSILLELLRIIEAVIIFSEEDSDIPKTGIKWIDKFMYYADKTSKAIQPLKNLDVNVEWWSNANTFKNRGFYVDYREQLLLPQDITEDECSLSKNIVSELYERITSIIDYFEKLPNGEKKTIIKLINQGLQKYQQEQKTIFN